MSFRPIAPTVQTLQPTIAEVARVREVVSAAFADDPMFAWLLPEPLPGAEGRAAWLGLFVEAFALGGVVDVVRGDDECIDGVALWRLGDQSPIFSSAPSVGGLLVSLIGPEAAISKGSALRAFAEHKPDPPFHYLQFLAVHPERQGLGLGRALLAHGQHRAASAGVAVYLESSNPANLAFYHSCGMERIGDFVLDSGGPPAFRLWWSPRTAQLHPRDGGR